MPAPSPLICRPELLNRREFFSRAGAGLAATALAPAGFAAAGQPTRAALPRPARASAAFPICALDRILFEKYSAEETAQTYAEIGVDIETTVRPNGHIKPANVAEELPAMSAAFARLQRRVAIIATSFVRPDEPHIEATLRTAKRLGITQYRHRGFLYAEGKPLRDQIASFRSMARDFAAMNREIGIQALYQNHAGAQFAGAAIWDLDQILDDIDPAYFAVALDTRHLLVEQGRAWPTAVQLIAPRVGALFVKSVRWDRDRTIETSLREGIVTADMVNQIVGSRPTLPVCFHVEHVKMQPIPFSERTETVNVFRDDAAVLREWLGLA